MFQAVPLNFTDSVDVVLIPTLLHRTVYSFMKGKSAIKYMIKIKSYSLIIFMELWTSQKNMFIQILKKYTQVYNIAILKFTMLLKKKVNRDTVA